jgi:hypothetical protein
MGRSRITNGRDLLAGVDQRLGWVRRFRDVFALHLSDLGHEDAVSEAEKSICRRAACITVALEEMERTFALAGCATSQELLEYGRASNTLRRLLESVGLQRRAKDVTPNLSDYLRQKAARAGGEVIDEEAAE